MNRTFYYFFLFFSLYLFDTILTPYSSFILHTYLDPGLNLGLKLKFPFLPLFPSFELFCILESALSDSFGTPGWQPFRDDAHFFVAK
mgnify:FL=1